MSFKKITALIIAVLMIVVSLSACALKSSTADSTESGSVQTSDTSVTTDDGNELFTDRDYETDYDASSAVNITLSGDTASASDTSDVAIDGSTVTITDEGVYILSGTLTDGQIIVVAQDADKVQLVLDGVTLNCSSGAAVYVKTADKVFITTSENSENTLTVSGEFAADGDTNVDAVIFSKSDLTLNGKGTITIATDYGNGITSKDDLKITSGNYDIDVSGKGLEANDSIRIADGEFVISCDDDALHSNDYTTIIGGTFTIYTGDDGIHSDGATTITGGTVNIENSYEGIEGQQIYISGGEISVKSSDDGLNAAGGNDQSGYGSMVDEFAADADALISISGGTLTVNAEGDGIDSNDSLEISGGTVYVNGPTNSGNGALDYNGTATITGGTLVAVGASGMAMNFSEANQGSILVNFSQSISGGEVTVTDSNGNTIVSFTASKSYNSVLVSSPDLVKGSTYTVTAGGQSETVNLSDNLYGSGSGMGMGGGRQGGGMGGRP